MFSFLSAVVVAGILLPVSACGGDIPTSWGRLKVVYVDHDDAKSPAPEAAPPSGPLERAQASIDAFPSVAAVRAHGVRKVPWGDSGLVRLVAASSGEGEQIRVLLYIMDESFQVLRVYSAGRTGPPPSEIVSESTLSMSAEKLMETGSSIMQHSTGGSGGVQSAATGEEGGGRDESGAVARESVCGGAATTAATVVFVRFPGPLWAKAIATGLAYGLVYAGCMSDSPVPEEVQHPEAGQLWHDKRKPGGRPR